LDLVYQLNERSFQLLIDAATQHRELWSALDAAAIQRAARFPFVILDVNFTDAGWWRAVSQNPERSFDEQSDASLWPAEVAEKLLGELLVFAWHTAKWDRRVARLSLGMLPGVVGVISALTPQQLDIVSRLPQGCPPAAVAGRCGFVVASPQGRPKRAMRGRWLTFISRPSSFLSGELIAQPR